MVVPQEVSKNRDLGHGVFDQRYVPSIKVSIMTEIIRWPGMRRRKHRKYRMSRRGFPLNKIRTKFKKIEYMIDFEKTSKGFSNCAALMNISEN